MQNLPFDKPGRFWRGNLHTHSTHSDGGLPPEEVCAFYRQNDYDFIAITDHHMERFDYQITDTHAFRTDDFTTLIGAEMHEGETELGKRWHNLAVGLPLDFAKPPPNETGPAIAKRALDEGAFVAAAHPQWYTLTENDLISLGDIHAIEVYNGGVHDSNDRADSWYLLDVMLERGRHYNAIATDDAHIREGITDALFGWVHVKSEALTPDSLLKSLKRGWFYSSTGPQIHDIRVTDTEITVQCSPAQWIYLLFESPHALSANGRGIREATFERNRVRGRHVRVTIRDSQGRRAWSNPFWLE